MSISTYFRPNIHQNGPEILGVNIHTCTFQKPYILLTYITISILYSNILPYTSIDVETVMRPLYSTPFCFISNTIFQTVMAPHYSTKMSMACHDIFVGIQKSSIFYKFPTSYWLIKYLNPKLISKDSINTC
jgi:hypothetical protein